MKRRRVIAWSETIGRVLDVMSGVGLIVIAFRVMGGSSGKIDVWDKLPKIPFDMVWLIFLAGTLIHAFMTFFFAQFIHDLLRDPAVSVEDKIGAFEDVTTDGSHYMRITEGRPVRPGSRIAIMSLRDPSTWISHLGAIALFLAIAPWTIRNGIRFPEHSAQIVGGFLMALTLTVANWLIGSQWAVALSRLETGLDADQLGLDGSGYGCVVAYEIILLTGAILLFAVLIVVAIALIV